MKIFTIFFPWITLFIYDNPGGAILALIMQCTIIGWLPAALWALRVVEENELQSKARKKEERSQNQR